MKVVHLVPTSQSSIHHVTYPEREVALEPKLKFFLAASWEDGCEGARLFLELLLDDEKVSQFEFEDCLDLSICPKVAVPLHDFFELDSNELVGIFIAATAASLLTKQADLEIETDFEEDGENKVKFLISIGDGYRSEVTVDHEEVDAWIRPKKKRGED